MKGVLLSGGLGTRLLPLTKITNKQLLPINKKLIIDYSLNTLIDLGCDEVIVVTGGDHFDQIAAYLEDGSDKGIHISYEFQKRPQGIAQAINICKSHLKDQEKFVVILGDNIFYNKYIKSLELSNEPGAQIFLQETPDMHELTRFGCAFIKDDRIQKIIEKPSLGEIRLDVNTQFIAPIVGCYVFDNKYFDYFKNIQKSQRGEYEIVSIMLQYLKDNKLNYSYINGAWWDAGNFKAIEEVRKYVSQEFEDRLK